MPTFEEFKKMLVMLYLVGIARNFELSDANRLVVYGAFVKYHEAGQALAQNHTNAAAFSSRAALNTLRKVLPLVGLEPKNPAWADELGVKVAVQEGL